MSAAAASLAVGETFSRGATLEAESISAFAKSVGDMNPLHHDAAFAKTTRFGGIIACGPQYASMLMGLVASHYGADTASVGLEFQFRFARPVRAGDTLKLTWTAAAVDFNPKLKGDIVTLDGSITNQDGVEVLTSTGKVVVFRNG